MMNYEEFKQKVQNEFKNYLGEDTRTQKYLLEK